MAPVDGTWRAREDSQGHNAMKSEVLVLYADREPMDGIVHPGPHQIYRNPRVSIETRALGDLHPNSIRVEMVYAGLCGTDVHLTDMNRDTGYIRTTAPTEIPDQGRIIGHEGVGKVIKIGSAVENLRPNAYVTFESIIACHHCDVCRRGQFNQCRNAKLVGLEADGLFGTVVDLPAMLAHDVTPLIKGDEDLKALACVEPAGVAYLACTNGRIKGGDVVAIFGGGPIGIYSAMLCKTVFGASAVHVVDPVKLRRTLAREWIDHAYDVEEFFDAGPRLVDAVIEASGDMDNVSRVMRRMDANGRIVLLARSGASLTVDAVDHLITNAVSICGARGHLGGAFDSILRLYRNGRFPLAEVVTGVVDGLEGLRGLLQSPERILANHCKVLTHLAAT
jgi:threonine dehydrogenase-like Zn-dependent dehydrogenase